MLFGLTKNPRKTQEYKEHFAQYGIKASLDIQAPPQNMNAFLSELKDGDIVFRETSSIHDQGRCLNLSYRDSTFHGQSAANTCIIDIWIKKTDSVKTDRIEVSIDGSLQITHTPNLDAFDWDDVFVANSHTRSLYETSVFSRKVSARQVALDILVSRYIPFKSNRAFKYGHKNDVGLVDLNYTPIRPKKPIQFDTLPYNTLTQDEAIVSCGILKTPIGAMLTHALSMGAHYRAASNKREWIYWAPGINAGIPLTPKEDKYAELVYLFHDFAHYASPDLIPLPGDDGFTKACILAHRMIGETMAMVIADMFLMDEFVSSNAPVDASSHGIYALYQCLKDPSASQTQNFITTLGHAVDILLKGKTDKVKDVVPADVLEKFQSKYSKFALADYEWTLANIENLYKRQDVLSNMASLISRVSPRTPVSSNCFKDISNINKKGADGVNTLRDVDIDADNPYHGNTESNGLHCIDRDSAAINGFLASLHLTSAREFSACVKKRYSYDISLSHSLSFYTILDACKNEILESFILPYMKVELTHTKEGLRKNTEIDNDVLTRTAKRYFLGQMMLFASHPDMVSSSVSLSAIQNFLTVESLSHGYIDTVRALYEQDLESMEKQGRITTMDRTVYLSVFPIVDASYVSYKNPNLTSYQDVFQKINALSLSKE